MTLALAMYGDPEDRRTWSGTPFNLAGAFRQLGAHVVPINSSHTRLLIKGLHALWTALAQQSRLFRRGPVARKYCARAVARELNRRRVSTVLHLSLNHLPLPRGHAARQFLFADLTGIMRRRYTAWTLANSEPRSARRLDTRAYQQMEHIFATSLPVRESLIRDYQVPPGRISVVGTGYSREFLNCRIDEEKYRRPRLLFVCKVESFRQDKGCDLLLAAFRRLRPLHPQATLTLVGRSEFLRYAAAQEGLVAHSFVSFEELLRLFEDACLYAMPALCEPWGLVYLEALASGTPVLGLSRLALPEITNHGEFGYLAGDATPQHVCQALHAALSDQDLLRKKGLAGRRSVSARFSWDKTAGQMLQEMLRGPADPSPPPPA